METQKIRVNKKNILVVEDEPAIRDMIRFALPALEFEMSEAGNAIEAKQMLESMIPDIILLDWMMPGLSGLELLKWIKQRHNLHNIPIIFLTAKSEEKNKIKGLNQGADDYITKPFSPEELIARIKAILRRGTVISPKGMVIFEQLKINTKDYSVSVHGETLKLTPTEYKLIYFLITHRDRVFSREQILEYVWKDQNFLELRSVDVQIKRLRSRLKHYDYDRYIQTVRGIGYCFSTKF